MRDLELNWELATNWTYLATQLVLFSQCAVDVSPNTCSRFSYSYCKFTKKKHYQILEDDSFSWDVAPCSLVEVDQYFRRTYCLHILVLFLLLFNIKHQ
jgi:hypothetical protein